MTDKPTGTRAPRRPNKTPEELDAEIARVRDREERKLIATADAAGYFNIRLTKDQLEGVFRASIETLNPKLSALAKLRDRKVHAADRNARMMHDARCCLNPSWPTRPAMVPNPVRTVKTVRLCKSIAVRAPIA